MDEYILNYVLKNHPDKKIIFELATRLEGTFPYWFNYLDDIKPTPFNHDGEDLENLIKWETYPFQIIIDCLNKQQLSVMMCRNGNHSLLEIENLMTNELFVDLDAEQAVNIIRNYFDNAN